ncbi:MAG TPA: hypothetical protein VK665_15655, partial [Candidatus Elarobacter sp.]|nr:hypothetical protein [Candidatus Elarobacter sp.]
FTGPSGGFIASAVALTNVSRKPLAGTDLFFVVYDAAGKRSFEKLTVTPSPSGEDALTGGGRLPAAAPYAKVYCTVGRVRFADGTAWAAPAGFLKDATAP